MSENEIICQNVKYEYIMIENEEKKKVKALDDISLEIKKGSFVSILGANGSGKSTLAKHFNALFTPKEGVVIVNGLNTVDDENVFEIRSNCGMVFQNPDNQIVGTIVEDDVAFGVENLGVPTKEIRERVDQALKDVGMYDFRKEQPSNLSGGQKQRISIAGILAMKPKCIVLDEPTAMLDPIGRKNLIDIAKKLNKEEGITIILITHFMEETVDCDKVVVMNNGVIKMEGTPREVFKQVDEVKKYGIDVPQVTEIANKLNKKGFDIPTDILTIEEMVGALCQ